MKIEVKTRKVRRSSVIYVNSLNLYIILFFCRLFDEYALNIFNKYSFTFSIIKSKALCSLFLNYVKKMTPNEVYKMDFRFYASFKQNWRATKCELAELLFFIYLFIFDKYNMCVINIKYFYKYFCILYKVFFSSIFNRIIFIYICKRTEPNSIKK